jgi:hypothetical protein
MSETLQAVLTFANVAGIFGLLGKALLDHTSARVLDANRQAAQESLEVLRSQLTLNAEVRRQAAAKKVELLVKIVAATNETMSQFFKLDVDSAGRNKAVHQWWLPAREADLLMGTDTLDELKLFSGAMLQAASVLGHIEFAPPLEFPDRAVKRLQTEDDISRARLRLFEALRRELPPEMFEKPETKR